MYENIIMIDNSKSWYNPIPGKRPKLEPRKLRAPRISKEVGDNDLKLGISPIVPSGGSN